ncbi:MAG: cytochrome c3 family protein [Candidatus Methanofastidiosia archaeon]
MKFKGDRRKGVYLAVALALLIFIAIFLFLSTNYVRNSRSCGNCHLMNPSIDSWKTSSHREVECMECHPESDYTKVIFKRYLKYATNTYGELRAEVKDESCIFCHKKDIEKPSGETRFEHLEHAKYHEPKAQCVSCHEGIVHKKLTVSEENCLTCHDGVIASDECLVCHKNLLEGEIFIGSVSFPHLKHEEKNLECEYCHLTILRREVEADMGFCDICHDIQSSQKCTQCHKNPEKISKMIETVEFLHQTHMIHLQCSDCHYNVIPLEEEITLKNCLVCHHLEEVKRACLSCHETLPEKILIREGEFHHSKHLEITQNECLKCHEKPEERVERERCTDCHHAREAPVICSLCHEKIRENIIFKEADKYGKFKDMVFSHQLHLSKHLECLNCHQRPTLEVDIETCKDCHHENQPPSECIKCHNLWKERTMFDEVVFIHKLHAERSECTECHQTLIPIGKTLDEVYYNTHDFCYNCHERETPASHDICFKCHFVTKPHNPISGCGVCHDQATQSMETCSFCHDVITQNMQVCAKCHNVTTPNHNVCILCHKTAMTPTPSFSMTGDGCGKCHSDGSADWGGAPIGPYPLSCDRCHG